MAYLTINIIVETLLAEDIELAIPKGIIIWETRGLISTIDLAFIN